jgi:hypothetical protein
VRVDAPSGEPGADLTWDTIEAKFHGLSHDLPGDAANAIVNWVKALPHPRRIGELTPLLRNTPRSSLQAIGDTGDDRTSTWRHTSSAGC